MMPRLRLQRTALGTRLRSLRERPLEQRHVRAALVLAAGLGLAAAGFAALGPSLGAFTATVSSQAEVGAGSLDLSLNAPSGQPSCSATAANGFSATCVGADVTTTGAPGQVDSVDWQAQSSGTITPENDPGFGFSLTPGSCSGSNSTVCGDTEVVVTEWDAQPDIATALPATGAGIDLAEVTCPSATTCVAVGRTGSSYPVGLALVSSDGGVTWSAPVLVPGTTLLQSVACPTSSTCVAVGYDGSSAGVASIGTAPATAGDPWSWTPPVDVTGTAGLQGVHCLNTTECVAVGANSAKVGVAVSSSDGGSSWSSPQPPSGTSFSYGVACPTPTTCLAVAAGASSGEAFVGTEGSGSWTWTTTSALALPSGDSAFTLSCPSADACLGSGNTASEGLVDTLDYSSSSAAWSWGTPQAIAKTTSLGAVSCTTTSDCVAVGGYQASSSYLSVTTATTDGGTTWSAPAVVSGPTNGFLNVACASGSGACVAVSYQHSSTSSDTGQSWVGYQPLACVYGTQNSDGTCTFSSADTLSSLGGAGTLTLQPSSIADPGVLVEVSTELDSSSTSDEGATATVPLSFTATA